jgi:hypothetical protein
MNRDNKGLTTAWVMKKEVNGKYRARLNTRGYRQVERFHFDIDSPGTNDTTIAVADMLAALAGWKTYVVDVQEI